MSVEIGQAAARSTGLDANRFLGLRRKVTELIEAIEAGLEPIAAERPAGQLLGGVLQFKITLRGIQPPIWRRIQILDCTLYELHIYIQAAFGWENCHLHEFQIAGARYGPPETANMGFGSKTKNEDEAVLIKLLRKSTSKARWVYEYDFGDSWRHEVLFENFLDADSGVEYPLCLEGERACPPEDCGGTWGYEDLLTDLADPEESLEIIESWGSFDPEEFDAPNATNRMRSIFR